MKRKTLNPTPGSLRFVWPAPVGLILYVFAYGVAWLFGAEIFLALHAVFMIGIMVSMFASVVYTIRLSGKEGGLVPRWVFVLNLCFGPLIFGVFIVSRLVSILIAKS